MYVFLEPPYSKMYLYYIIILSGITSIIALSAQLSSFLGDKVIGRMLSFATLLR